MAGKNKQKKMCTCAVREIVSKIERKVVERVIHCEMALQVAVRNKKISRQPLLHCANNLMIMIYLI